jgi:hypothetical protein
MIKDISTQNKRAVIEQAELGYTVRFYMDGRIYQKTTVHSIHEANELCDLFLDSDPSQKLLNEAS